MKVGVFIESFKKPIDEALDVASKIGAKGFQMYLGVFKDASKQEKQDFRNKIKDKGLELSAICGDMGYKIFYHPEENQFALDYCKSLFDLAYEFEVPALTSHIGVVPEEKNSKRYEVMLKMYKELADYAHSANSKFAVETGPEPSTRLKSFLDDVNSKGAAVNLDPANLIMVQKEDPVQAVYNLKDYIVHTHAKDGIWIKPSNPEALYVADILGIPHQERGHYKEVPLGEGQVPWDRYLNALKDIGFDGFLAIEREVGENPEKDIKTAMTVLNAYLSKI